MQIEQLYDSQKYNQRLVDLAGKNLLPFDDYRQEVFLWLIENGGDPWKAAKRIAMRMKRKQIRDDTVSLEALGGASNDHDGVLWEELHVI